MSNEDKRFGINNFFYSKSPGVERKIMTFWDGIWEFEESGNPIEIEVLNYYKTRLKKKRLNKDIIFEYMRRLGINFYDIDEDITHYLNLIQTRW